MLQSILARRKAVIACYLCYSLAAVLPVLLLAGAPAKSGQGAAESPVMVKLLIDRKQNKDFLDEQNDVGEQGFAYEFQDVSPDRVVIRPASAEIMGVWKGNGTIRNDTTGGTSQVFEEKIQFAPVLLVVDLTNKSERAVQLSGAYLDVAESASDLQPFLSVNSGDFEECGFVAEYNPELQFLNEGWGSVEDAKLSFSFGNAGSTGGDAFSADVGTFGDVAAVSVAEALAASGLNVETIKAGGFKCKDGEDEIWNCMTALSDAGLLGSLADSVFPHGKNLLTRVAGTLDYRWTDSKGIPHERHSPVSADISLLKFDTGVEPECGAAGPIEREFKTVKLSLDRAKYRIPLPVGGQLGPLENKRFALSLVAAKSSQHFFRVVLQLSDGGTVASPNVDLLYFIPRIVETN